jgi:hypothetical protein
VKWLSLREPFFDPMFQVFLDTVMVGNLAEKSLAFAAILMATCSTTDF